MLISPRVQQPAELPLLEKEEVSRYARHLILPEVGVVGQRRLKNAKVLCIGTGGLGSPITMYLAAAGIGTIGLVDFDTVDLSNLQRQILHTTSDVGRKKLESAHDHLQVLNPHIDIVLHDCRFDANNAAALVAPYDIVIDGTDNFPTRYLSNDICVFEKKVNIYGSIFRFEGQTTVFAPHLGGPCYRCVFPEPPPPDSVPSCAEGGVIGVLPGMIGVLQATEAIKLICGIGDPLIGRLLHFDSLKMKFREFHLRKDPRCPVCSSSPTITAPIDYHQFCGGNAQKETSPFLPTITPMQPEELAAKLQRKEKFLLLDVREPAEFEIAHIKGCHLIPLGELPIRMEELDRTQEIVVYCKSGVRSARAAGLLLGAGFSSVSNLEGGILAWANRIDSSMATY